MKCLVLVLLYFVVQIKISKLIINYIIKFINVGTEQFVQGFNCYYKIIIVVVWI